MPATTRELLLPDGRRADILVGGTARGPALILHHGTPSDATVWLDWDGVAREHGLQLVSISRPGYATSTRLPGRTVADAAADVADVLATLDVPWFVTAGWSGGGPHALACAALLGDRCRSAATLAGVAQCGQPDLDFLAGMGPENVAEFGAATSGESALQGWLAEHGELMRRATGAELAAAFGGLVAQPDKDVLVGGFAERLADATRRALAPGFDGWIDDDLAFVRPWGVDVGALAVSVTIWQGDLDLMVPFEHGRWLGAHIPTANVKIVRGHGHLSLVAGSRDEIVRDLLAHAAEAAPD